MPFDPTLLLPEETSSGFDESLLVPEEQAPTSESLSRMAGLPEHGPEPFPNLKPSSGQPLSEAMHETFGKLKVPAQTMQNAWDVTKAYGGRVGFGGMIPTTSEQMQEELVAPDQPPSTGAKIASGVQAGGINLAETFSTPEGVALAFAGGVPGVAGRVISAGFLADMLRQTPEVYQKLGDAFGRNDPQAEAEAIFDAVAHGGFAAGLGHATFKGANPAVIKRSIQEFVQRTPREQRQQLYDQAKGEPNAIQERSAAPLPVGETPGDSGEVGARGPQQEKAAAAQEAPQEGVPEVQRDLEPPENVRVRDQIINMPAEDVASWAAEVSTASGSPTRVAYEIAKRAKTQEFIDSLKEEANKINKKHAENPPKTIEDIEKFQAEALKAQLLNEAWGYATGVGSGGTKAFEVGDTPRFMARGQSFDDMLNYLRAEDRAPFLATYSGELGKGRTGYGHDLGSKARTPEDVAKLKALYEKLRGEFRDARTVHDEISAMKLQARSQAAHEAYQAATGANVEGQPTKSAIEAIRGIKSGYEPPVPHENYKTSEAQPAGEAKAKQAPTANIPEGAGGTEVQTFYQAGETTTRGGIQYVASDRAVAEKFAQGGEFGRPGAQVKTLEGNLNIFDASKESPERIREILGPKNLQYVEPDGYINFYGFEGDPSIQARLKDAGYDGIKISEGTSGTSVAVLPHAKSKLKAQPVPAGEAVPAVGPGAASPKDIGTSSQISQLTQSIQNTVSPKQTMAQRVQSAVGTIKGVPKTVGQAIKTGVQKLAAVTGAIKSGLTKLPTFTDFKRVLGVWDGADQQAAHETRKFVQMINSRIPKNRQEAMNNWIQADGDIAVLKQRAAATSNPKLKRGYEEAQQLTPEEKIAAQNIGNYYDAKLQEGLASGLLEHGLENYINHVWKKPNPVTQKLQADLATGKLNTNFKFARQRIFEHYFEGEQAGYTPANKTVGALIGIYDQSFNRALSARGFVKNLTQGKASDGRDLVAVSGSGSVVEGAQTFAVVPQSGGNARRVFKTQAEAQAALRPGERIETRQAPEALLIRPKTKPDEAGDYRSMDHPALRKWMWQTESPQGNPVLVQGDLLVHPEIYRHLKNVLGKSAWRQNKLGRAILGTESTIKQLLFSLSGFHQVQETLHALGHRVNPTNLAEIDFDNPVHKEAVEHGLQLASYDALEQFTDGLGSGPLINRIPLIGKRILGPYTEWLFQDYIPRLKMTMYEHALERNTERYADQLSSGKMNRDQLLELTAKQANAAFGEQNYNWMGRNKTMQDALRAFIVAPDFLEARAKFTGQVLRSHGREQLVALGLLAATQYIASRVLNKALDDDYHWDKPFSLVVKKHEYELRSVPGDIAHLIKDPKKFVTSRLSPIMRQAVEFITGRDYRGIKRDALDQVKDFAKLPIPISMRRQDDQKWWETFLNAFGVHERSATASQEIADKARQFREKAKGKADVEILESQDTPYRKLRVSLDVGKEKAALQALQELRKTRNDSQIFSTMQSHIRHPFTGSEALERKFKQSLEPVELKKYQEALAERKERFQKFKQLWAKRGQKEKLLQTTEPVPVGTFDPSLLVPE